MLRDVLPKIARIAGFIVLTAGLFVVALGATSKIRYGDHTLLQSLAHNHLEPGGRYHSLRRFREAESRGHVEIVFFGSSHAYRGFDPRIFAEAGYASMNLGSTNQTPLNSYYLAERYLPKLTPDLVVVELYYHTLSTDGLEATRDLAVNTVSAWPMAKMAAATQNVGAMTFASAKALGLAANESKAEQQDVGGETYVPGGYCEADGHRSARTTGDPLVFDIAPRQLDWLADLTELARSHGARVVWVTHPLPDDHTSRIANRERLRGKIDAAAARARVEYWDFNDTLTLDALEDFHDFHHLATSGVAKFDRALLARLRSTGYLR